MPEAAGAEVIGSLLFEEAAALGVGELVGAEAIGSTLTAAGATDFAAQSLAGASAGFTGGEAGAALTGVEIPASFGEVAIPSLAPEFGLEQSGTAPPQMPPTEGVPVTEAGSAFNPAAASSFIPSVGNAVASATGSGFLGNLIGSPLSTLSSFVNPGGGGSSPGSGFAISPLSAGLTGISSLIGLTEAQKLKKLAAGGGANSLQAKADPFGASGTRAIADEKTAALLRDPSSITTMPGYEAGLQAVQRAGAANGWLGSGNMMASIAKFGNDFYSQALQQLSGIAGAGFNPASGAQVALQGTGASNAMQMAALSNLAKSAQVFA